MKPSLYPVRVTFDGLVEESRMVLAKPRGLFVVGQTLKIRVRSTPDGDKFGEFLILDILPRSDRLIYRVGKSRG